jgi:dolichol-phosphate mannosyltransferase
MKSSQAKSSVSVFVPALNEQDHIESTVETVVAALVDARVEDYDIILVNDGSTDRTGEVMDRIAGSNPRIQVVHHKQNMGLGTSYRHAIEVAKKE